ncbi:MAG: hypothetical protein K6T78_16325 [Alicyclobacillus sp.]|nr:hypothetical protein [Alicyclobacillus sp.]
MPNRSTSMELLETYFRLKCRGVSGKMNAYQGTVHSDASGTPGNLPEQLENLYSG